MHSALRATALSVIVVLMVTASHPQSRSKGRSSQTARQAVSNRATALLETDPATFVRFEYNPDTYKQTHPRLPIPDTAYLERLRGNSSMYSTYKRYADQLNPAGSTALATTSALLIMAYATNDADYMDKVKKLFRTNFPNYGTHAKVTWKSYAYDWLYDRFSDEEKAEFREILFKDLLGLESGMVGNAPSPFNDVGYNRYESAVLTGSMVLYPDHPRAKEHLDFALAYYNDILETCRHIMGRTGGWHEGIEYAFIGVSKVIPRILSEWKSASGQDMLTANPWAEGMIYYPIYTMRPDRTSSRWSDVAWDATLADNAIWPLSVMYNNPYGLWFARRMTLSSGGTVGGVRKPNGIDPSLYPWGPPDMASYEEKPLDDLPLTWRFEGTGAVVMRSGWSEDDTQIEFKAGPNFWSHNYLDQGAFTIYRRGGLAIDAGVYYNYGDSHHLSYRMQTISKNTIVVYDPADQFKTPSGMKIANDGGQRRVSGAYGVPAPSQYMDPGFLDTYRRWAEGDRSAPVPMPSGPSSLELWKSRSQEFEAGHTTSYETAKDYTFIGADLTKAYNNELTGTDPVHRTNRISSFTRNFVYAGLQYVVVFDRVVTTNPSFQKKWLLHTINEPSVSGSEFTITRADLVTHVNVFATGLKYSASNTKKYQYAGKLLGRTLLPESANIHKVGGPEGAFEVDGTNYSATRYVNAWRAPDGVVDTDPLKGPQEPGAWRLEVTPPEATEEDFFLHLLYPTEASNEKPLPASALLKGDNFRGLTIEDSNRPWVVIFGKPGSDTSTLHYTVAAAGQANHLIGNLAPGNYRVSVGDQVYLESVACPQGVLFFEGAGTSSYTIQRLTE